ncbi:cytochrome C biogenesis protein CcdA [Actinomycetospora sp. NBRC 106375]|uniref:cytochrome c biogenesis CcdA family protein n=1 Tax=Actinomycetospora sp. NBRC 106375 TaxID=3032207 RepID=UPI0024A2115E|nr:cytochrome c biogenesis CcdA family protein [Actinomycetospora sp. NBRC 106375]GLZ48835.1 cytochrome C biogenesis protein CcdA [Actinomycetospora sp. NBRC 106375]
MLDIGYAVAFAGGVLALLSPCSALLLPSFFAYAFSGRTELVARTGVFLLGLVVVLVPLGAGSGALAALLTEYRAAVITAAGTVIVVLGVVQILGGGWALAPAARLQSRMARRGTWLATLGLGAAYGLAGFCSGPVLGAVLTVAAAGGQALRGAALLAVYAAGMALPLFLLAALWQRFDLGRRRWLRGRPYRLGPLHLHTTTTISGLLFVVIGVLFVVFDGTAGLTGADPSTAAAAEETVVSIGDAVPDLALLGAAAVAIGLITWWSLRRHRAPTAPADTDRDPGDDEVTVRGAAPRPGWSDPGDRPTRARRGRPRRR